MNLTKRRIGVYIVIWLLFELAENGRAELPRYKSIFHLRGMSWSNENIEKRYDWIVWALKPLFAWIVLSKRIYNNFCPTAFKSNWMNKMKWNLERATNWLESVGKQAPIPEHRHINREPLTGCLCNPGYTLDIINNLFTFVCLPRILRFPLPMDMECWMYYNVLFVSSSGIGLCANGWVDGVCIGAWGEETKSTQKFLYFCSRG